jgi:hypothetical protein
VPADRPQCPPPASMWLPDCTMLQDQKRRDARGASAYGGSLSRTTSSRLGGSSLSGSPSYNRGGVSVRAPASAAPACCPSCWRTDRSNSLGLPAMCCVSQPTQSLSIDTSPSRTTGEDLREYMKSCGLEAWHAHISKHTSIRTPGQLKMITAFELRRMATGARAQRVRGLTLQMPARRPYAPPPSLLHAHLTCVFGGGVRPVTQRRTCGWIRRLSTRFWRRCDVAKASAKC